MAPVEHVVADAGAFLRDAPLQDIGKNIYTIREVVREIRDKATRRRLAVLPYQLRFKEPLPEYVRLVTEFSKKTGDYPSLSATDIQVLALTYQLEAEFVGVSHLKKEPEKAKVSSSIQHPETALHISGFHLPSKVNPFRSPGPPWALTTTWHRPWQQSTSTWTRSERIFSVFQTQLAYGMLSHLN
uniref:RNA-binding protein NOB1 n=1 Tax=Mus musculus TaxID=10090 RepID=Q8BW77_MOUSE|nr:unnamed protein product [Mus musculus]